MILPQVFVNSFSHSLALKLWCYKLGRITKQYRNSSLIIIISIILFLVIKIYTNVLSVVLSLKIPVFSHRLKTLTQAYLFNPFLWVNVVFFNTDYCRGVPRVSWRDIREGGIQVMYRMGHKIREYRRRRNCNASQEGEKEGT